MGSRFAANTRFSGRSMPLCLIGTATTMPCGTTARGIGFHLVKCVGSVSMTDRLSLTFTRLRKDTAGIEKYLSAISRLLMSSLFIWDGVLQLRNPASTAQYFARVHVPMPDLAIWISIPLHLFGGLALLLGFRTRWAAALLALICLATALGVHLPEGDADNMIHFYKNLVMAGGFLYVVAYGPGGISID